jgi:tetratricopeptide (TPR) repeat protein
MCGRCGFAAGARTLDSLVALKRRLDDLRAGRPRPQGVPRCWVQCSIVRAATRAQCGPTSSCCGDIFGNSSLVQPEALGIETGSFDERFLKDDCQDFASLFRLGISKARAGQLDEAEPPSRGSVTHYQQALACEPNNADIHNNLDVALNTHGQFTRTSGAFARAVSRAPRKAEFYLNLLGSKRITADDPHLIAALELYCDVASLGIQSQIALHFALGRAFADLDEHECSFRHLTMGNALKRRELIYDEATALGLFARTRATFTS